MNVIDERAQPVYRILIVDDTREVRRMLRAGIETLGQEFKVIDVPSGEEAILVLSRYPINLLITDIRLPGMSGLELKERAQVRNPGLRFILITGMEDQRIRRQVANVGADAFFFKPITMGDFLDAVQRCLGLLGPSVEEIAGVEEAPPPTLSERLSSLRREAQAPGAFLLGDREQILAQAGDFPAGLDGSALISALLATYSVSAKVGHQLGEQSPSGVMVFSGHKYDLLLCHLGPSISLLLIVPANAWEDGRVNSILPPLRLAARDLLAIFARMGVPAESKPTTPDQTPARRASSRWEVDREAAVLTESLPELEPVEDLPDLEALLKSAAQAGLTTEVVDAFWDSLTIPNPDSLTRSDAISYEQARQLGLAPEE
jgi:CheY-like chemotaxis protein